MEISRRQLLIGGGLAAVGGVTTATRLLTASQGSGGFTQPTFDDEFDSGNLGWTLSNTCDIGVTTAGRLHMEGGSNAHRARIPAMPFTVTAYVPYCLFPDLTSFGGFGLAVAQATPTLAPDLVFWGPDLDNDISGTLCNFDARWAGAVQTHLGTKMNETAGLTLQRPIWFRLVVHSSSNIDAYWSDDGVTYNTYGTGFDPTMTVGAIVMFSYGVVSEWEWIRFS